ncbi:DEAD/DEAH box helicase [Edaphobacter sp. 12200R-103]|uniref:DEAD/DEAH box helicase n=1 Tax=Edaphobacter sp. 12200R-103 TaxID=2703788 RepID=UPI00138D530E|nr:DEAD/DEAH box helicase [Edaphobacter sp. 12200R-103]QHS53367.1 DEAD/DEAH box helicase [Edaphobacter sp. 12200R-103]
MPAAAEALEIPTSLAWAHPVTAEWFLRRFGSPTEPQQDGWPSILAGNATLISAPTGSGKTLAAFLVCIDKLLRDAIAGTLAPATQVVYVSPLKALSNDVQKNLDQPLREIQQLALERGYLSTEIRTGVRTGDTLPKERAAMLRNPPHILVTTPESLYILLTAGKSREHLRGVRTVIVDEIHAVADDKRGAHLALSLERLDALVCGENRLSPGAFLTGMTTSPQRIGLSATQNPIELVADFLTGVHPSRPPATIVQVGQRRHLDLAIEVPSDELSAVLTTKMWEEIFDKLAAYTQTHRSTLVFVNTRRLVEKIAFALAERIGSENVAAHHGSLSRTLRLDAEQRLKSGQIKILVATASLELGIDIGDVDLVCQIATTRAVSVAMQRVGRAGHWRGAIPKGRFFATTRDDLMEQAALVRSMRTGSLDHLEVPPEPIDVLMQQIVAACGAEPWEEDALYSMLTRAWPYRNLTRLRFDEIVALLTSGIESSRGRYGAYLSRDGIHRQLHPRRGARMIAISNGGAIPETNLYSVVLQPDGVQIATLDEHFAVDSSPGDVVLLGNASWRIQRIEAAGRVLVEDAHGAPPSLPFWEGEAPQRTAVLSTGVGELREQISAITPNVVASHISPSDPEVAAATTWLMENCGVCAGGAHQMIQYIVMGRTALGAVPSKTTIVAERFFDEGGGMQLILHAPFGGRINKAWGLALRKRFCRGFNFELQAAATDNGINIALAEQHSFPLADVFQFLTEHTAKELLEQASLASPIFKTRWRWAANRSLQLLRYSKGKRIAPQIQRTRSEDLLASVFPQAAACFENIEGDIQIPDHPLVDEVMKDVLSEAMDLEGLIEVLRGIKEGSIRCLAVDTPVPSQFAHELLNANPYAFLDEAGLEERRARAVSLSRTLPASVMEEAGRLDQEAIDEIRRECWPDLRDHHELHDLLHSLVALPLDFFAGRKEAKDWPLFYDRLLQAGRARMIECSGISCWVSTERDNDAAALWGDGNDAALKEKVLRQCVQGWVQLLGPTTANAFAERLGLKAGEVFQAFLAMEMQGLLMRGVFEGRRSAEDLEIEWCERRILHRIHRRTLHSLRKQIEPVSPAVYMRWLLGWQHLAPQTQLIGEEGVLEALHQLEGFEAPAIEWERTLLSSRVANYDSRWLDSLCLSGLVGWGRISPHPAWSNADGGGPRRVVPTNAAPITFYIRETAEWLPHALGRERIEESRLSCSLTPEALQVHSLLQERGACFANDISRILGLSRQATQLALWELATAGLASADGFDQLRAMMDPRRKSVVATSSARRIVRSTAGRWSLLNEVVHAAPSPVEQARRTEEALDSYARMLLHRYGVLFRDLLLRESNAPKWRDLVGILRRLEARGEIRGGRFVTGFGGEQFALPEAADSLRSSRTKECDAVITVAGADPMNLAGVILPGDRIPSIPGRQVFYRNGKIYDESDSTEEVKGEDSPSIVAPLSRENSLFSHAEA